MLLAAGFETASQLSALILAGQNNALLVGAVFSSGMVLVDGVDGYLAASMVRRAAFGEARAKWASRLLGLIVVIFAFGLGGAELFGVDFTGIALPLGLALFATVLGIRIWARSSCRLHYVIEFLKEADSDESEGFGSAPRQMTNDQM